MAVRAMHLNLNRGRTPHVSLVTRLSFILNIFFLDSGCPPRALKANPRAMEDHPGTGKLDSNGRTPQGSGGFPWSCVSSLWALIAHSELWNKSSPFGSVETHCNQCRGSVTFWCGFGSPDPYLWLLDPDPHLDPTPDLTLFFTDFKVATKKYFFPYFFLITSSSV